jgi:hypothetical protein
MLVALAATPALPDERPADAAWPRVAHHLDEASRLASHFEGTYLAGELQRVVLLVAHVEQAWVEAKTTDDDDVRRAAKAPRRRVQEARGLVDKLAGCAEANGTHLPVGALWRWVEQEVPRARGEITLPR